MVGGRPDLISRSRVESEKRMTMSPSVIALIVIGVIAVLVYIGVVLPAVWSVCPERRCAAARVLDTILRASVELATVLRPQPSLG
jgi:hypothetical protein